MDTDERTGFRPYWKRVACRAWADTCAFYPLLEDRRKAAKHILGQLLAAGALVMIAEASQVSEEINVWLSFMAATAILFFVVLLWNAALAPSHIDTELRKENKKLAIERATSDEREEAADELQELAKYAYSIREMRWSDAVEWEQQVVEAMKRRNLSKEEIYMFETISNIPEGFESPYPGLGEPRQDDVTAALNAKLGKLRHIISRLLRDETNVTG